MGSSAASSAGDAFTSEMRDRQARGKDPYGSGHDDGDLNGGESGATPLRLGRGRYVIPFIPSSSILSLPRRASTIDTNPHRSTANAFLDGTRAEKEDFGSIERRQKAVAFLDSPELLMMYAQSTGVVSPLTFTTIPLLMKF